MSCIHENQWITKDGRKFYVFEMSDAHVANSKKFLERRLANEEYRLKNHMCPVDISDGPCFDCMHEEETKGHWEEWIKAFDLELRRRAADAARRNAATAKP